MFFNFLITSMVLINLLISSMILLLLGMMFLIKDETIFIQWSIVNKNSSNI